jgi:nucleoside phosphorylase
MPKLDVDDLILNYDPEFPQQRFLDAGLEAALRSSTGRLPSAVPWPDASRPVATPLDPPPKPNDDLARFHGYDAIVVTWTAAEAAALGALLTPDYLPSRWYQYQHGAAAYVPLVTGNRAPFNDKAPDMARYYHCMGLYFPCQIGAAKVLLFKSGLHLDYDGPATPVRKLMLELIQTIQPKVFITTGTGGGIGADVLLGDVVIAGTTRFDCVAQFKSESWRNASFTPSVLPTGALAAIAPELMKPNAARVPGARAIPKIWAAPTDTIVTTDFFGFDDSTDHYKLQGVGARVCDMGDAMVGDAMQAAPGVDWYAIRNASDPQIQNTTNNIEAAKQKAGQIYAKYGAFTTAGSVIAAWAVIDAAINKPKGNTLMAKADKRHPVAHGRQSHDPSSRLAVRRPSEHGGYGWTRDLPDARDYLYAAPSAVLSKGLPPSVDLRAKCPPVYDQGQLGCCTGNGIAGAIEFDQRKQGATAFTPSRLFIYYNERVMEGTVSQDSGAQIRDGVKSVATLGAPPETDWPYDIAKFAAKPPATAYSDAKQDLVTVYSKVSQNLAQMQGCLAEGYPFVLGFTVYESFEGAAVAKSGVVPMPSHGEAIVGGHCVVAVGYENSKRVFLIRNSWGKGWGVKGYCTMPFEYLLSPQYASDFWTIRSIKG